MFGDNVVLYRNKISLLKNKVKSENGQSMVEFAVIIPIFMLLVCAVIDYGWIGFQYIAFDYSARSTTWTVRTMGKKVNEKKFKEEMAENAAGINPDWLKIDNFKVKDSKFDPSGLTKSDNQGRYTDDQGVHTILGGNGRISKQWLIHFESSTRTWYMRAFDVPGDPTSPYSEHTLSEDQMGKDGIADHWLIRKKDLKKMRDKCIEDSDAWLWIGYDPKKEKYIWIEENSMKGEKVARYGIKVTDDDENKYVLWKEDSSQEVRHVEATLIYTFPRLTPVNKMLASLFGSGGSSDTISIHKDISKDMIIGRHDEGKTYYRKVG